MLDLQCRLPEINTLTTPHADTYSRQAIRVFTMWQELCQKVRILAPSLISGHQRYTAVDPSRVPKKVTISQLLPSPCRSP